MRRGKGEEIRGERKGRRDMRREEWEKIRGERKGETGRGEIGDRERKGRRIRGEKIHRKIKYVCFSIQRTPIARDTVQDLLDLPTPKAHFP